MYILPPELIAAFDSDVVRPVNLVYINWPGGAVYAHNGVGTISYDGHVWLGLSSFADIGEVENNSNIGARTVTLGLSGIDPKALNEVVTKNVINREVELHYGALDENNRLISAVPYFYGRISSTAIKRYGSESISIQATEKMADWMKNRTNRYSDESYRSEYPNDDFLQYIAIIADRALYWNSDKESTPLEPRKRT